MLGYFFAFVLGVFLAPAVRPLFRPMMVEMVRAGLAIADEIKRATAEVQEGVEDVKAEAEANRAARSSAPATGAPAPDAPPGPVVP
jgi:hypothetical protein